MWVAHAPGMPGTFPQPPRVSYPDMHYGTCVTHVPWCMPGSLTSGFLWSRWWGKRSRHSRRMCNPQIYVSSKRPMAEKKLINLNIAFNFRMIYRQIIQYDPICPLYSNGLALTLTWISNHIHYKVIWKYLSVPNFNCAAVSNFISHFADYLSMLGIKLIYVNKRGPGI